VRGLFDRHVDDTTLQLMVLDPGAVPVATASHLHGCARCQARAGHARRRLDATRAAADAAADEAFSAADLERQRRAILSRILRGHRPARVLAFPGHDATGPRPRADRRWLADAAAAGLVLGALAGQLPHLDIATPPAARADAPAVASARADSRPLEDPLLSEVDAALDAAARPELRALDALTPVHYEIR
jgi:hypothetical protein